MKRNYLLFAIVLLFITLSEWSCQPTQYDGLRPAGLSITIEEAKAWHTTQQANARLSGGVAEGQGEEYWILAQQQTFTTGRGLVAVPLTYGYELATAYLNKAPEPGQPLDVEHHLIQSKLVIYKDDKGRMQANLIRIIPTEADRASHPRVKGRSFSGYVIRYDAAGKVALSGWTYRDGKLRDVFDYSTRQGGRRGGDCSYVISRRVSDQEPSRITDGSPSYDPSTVRVSFGGLPTSYR